VDLGLQNGGRGGAVLTPNELVFSFGVPCQFLRKSI